MAFKNYSLNKKKNSELKYEVLEKFGELDVEIWERLAIPLALACG